MSLSASVAAPLPDISKGSLRAGVEEFARIPRVDGQPPRISQMDVTANGAIYVVDQLGPLYFVSTDGSDVTEYLDLRGFPVVGLTRGNNEAGFQSAAFHPDFERKGTPGFGKFYTISSSVERLREPDFEPRKGDAFDTILLEWQCADPSERPFRPLDPDQPFRELMRIRQPYGNHNSGLIAFNPNAQPGDADHGLLYCAIGDGGAGGDPQKLGQDLGRIYGKILRIDPLGSNATNGRYGLPDDNPFVGRRGALPEIWAYGLRNPQRFRWDRGGERRMFISDIGQNAVEEIDIGVAGGNYGWNEREGSFRFGKGAKDVSMRADSTTTGFIYPFAQYPHPKSGQCAVTTGTVYRGRTLPGLEGMLLFGDIPSGRIFYVDADHSAEGGTAPALELRLIDGGKETSFLDVLRAAGGKQIGRTDLRFGSDAQGEIYLLNKQDGVIRRLVGTR